MDIYLPIADMVVNLYTILALGFITGMLSGLYGIGGGIISTPMMIFCGIPAYIAVGTASAIISGTAFSGTLRNWKNDLIDFKSGTILFVGGYIGSWCGIQVFTSLKSTGNLNTAINLVYIAVLFVTSFIMIIDLILGKRIKNGKERIIPNTKIVQIHDVDHNDLSIISLLMSGCAIGIISAIMGVGGAIIMVPMLSCIGKMPFRVASATALYQSLFVSVNIAIVQSIRNHAVDIVLCTIMLSTSIIGVQIGSRIASKCDTKFLKMTMILLIIAICIQFILITFVKPNSLFVLD